MAEAESEHCLRDVTGTVDVSRMEPVRDVALALYAARFPGSPLEVLDRSFADLKRLYQGDFPGYHACDMAYHDLRHVLDVSLAMVRLVDGYQRCHSGRSQFSYEQALLGMIVALYHDVGYIRRRGDSRRRSGAEYTRIHVSRGAAFLKRYLPTLGLGRHAQLATRLIQFTGYEMDVGSIRFRDPRYRRLGQLLGTADIIAQMADPCYLDKCRDRLFPEFLLGGMTREVDRNGRTVVRYRDAVDLLRKTPAFMREALEDRLGALFDGAHRYAAVHFGGRDLYLAAVLRNRARLEAVLDNGKDSRLLEPFNASCV